MEQNVLFGPRVFRLTSLWKRRFFFCIPLLGNIVLFAWIAILVYGLWGPATRAFGSIKLLLIGTITYIFCVMILYCTIYMITRRIYHSVNHRGITFCSSAYCIYSPWNNVREVVTRQQEIYHEQALLLEQPAIVGRIRDGQMQGRATMELAWFLRKKEVRNDAIPLLFTVPENWQESELGAYIRHYAPQAFDAQ